MTLLSPVFTYTSVVYGYGAQKPARRLVDQRGRRSRTLYTKLNKWRMQSSYAMQLSGVNSPN